MNEKEKIEMNETAARPESGKKKALRIGAFSVTLTVAVIVVTVLVNLIVSEIPSTLTKFDMTEQNYFTISSESADVIDGVDEDVTFYLLAQRGTEDSYILELLDRYAAMNSKIRVRTVDPVADPGFLSQYTDKSLSNNSVLAVSGKRSYPVDYYDIYVTEYSDEDYYYYYYYGQIPTGTSYFRGELLFSTALDYVTRDDLPVMYVLTGHGETDLDDAYRNYVTAANVALESISLLSVDEIPADCTVILINNPTADLSQTEAEMLTGYLEDGGQIILVTGMGSYESARMPNLTELAELAGMMPADGLVVETNRANYTGYPHYLLPVLGSGEEGPLALLSNRNLYVLAATAHGILPKDDADVITLLSTTTSAYVKKDISNNTLEMEEGDEVGRVMIGAATEVPTEDPGVTGKFVWYSSATITDSGADQAVSGGNSALFMASVNWMARNKTDLSVAAKTIQKEALTLSESSVSLWSIVLIFVIPLLVLIGGFVIWLRRRRK